MPTRPAPTRLAGKEHTRQSLVRAVLALLADRSLDSLSLREVARRAGVTPAAFYRHYAGLEELGLDLVRETFGSLGQMMKSAGAELAADERAVERSLGLVVGYRHDHASHLRFVVRERDGGLHRVRRAMARELRLMTDELAVDLAAVPALAGWSREDRRALAGAVTDTVLRLGADLLEADPDDQAAMVERTGRRLRLLGLGGTAPGAAAHSGDADQSMDGG
jgi:AcrR family transcriptional regulator